MRNTIFVLGLLLVATMGSLSKEKITNKLRFTVSTGKEESTFEIGLFGAVVPKTVENFRLLCNGELGEQKGVKMSYVGSKFHRIIPNFMIQGGDFTNHNGTGGMSIYGAKFSDENFKLKHEPFCLSMANSGPNTNGSQFFITTAATDWLNGKHVVFGRITQGMDTIKKIESFGSSQGTPSSTVTIVGCQEIEVSA